MKGKPFNFTGKTNWPSFGALVERLVVDSVTMRFHKSRGAIMPV